MKSKKIVAGLLVALILNPVGWVPVRAEGLTNDAKSAILMEVETGKILYETNMNVQLEPASMTKMMGMYLVMEAIENGVVGWQDKLRVSEHAASLGGSQIFLAPGEEMSVEDLFKSVAIASANDSITALGERVAGSEERFVEMMNEKAKTLGMINTVFKNPTGLPADGHVTTAYDMAILARALIQDFPDITRFTSMYEDFLRTDRETPSWLVNTNKLLKANLGVDGLKTGYTQRAGYNLTATAMRDGMRVVTVVMGATKSTVRNEETSVLISHAFDSYQLVRKVDLDVVVEKGYNMLAKNRQFDVVTMDSISVLKNRAAAEEETRHEIELFPDVELPIEPGTEVGQLRYFYNGEEYRVIGLTVSETVEKNSFLGLFAYMVSQLLFGQQQ
ncbi:MAG: D-alanyl-D-alanine carboxypeptidase [Turicibacter sp.]|nr:D-alanyl-D-alanine carboxypeptidase [Turicibacter sp.]